MIEAIAIDFRYLFNSLKEKRGRIAVGLQYSVRPIDLNEFFEKIPIIRESFTTE